MSRFYNKNVKEFSADIFRLVRCTVYEFFNKKFRKISCHEGSRVDLWEKIFDFQK